MDIELKEKIKNAIMVSPYVPVFKKVSPIQFVIRCPICGDSQKNLRDAHCYIKCSNDPNEPMLYNCFKCNSGGIVNQSFLRKIGISDTLINQIGNQRFNRLPSLKKADINIVTGTPDLGSLQVRYIEHRLGPGLSIDDYERFKIVWDINLIAPYISDKRSRNTLPSNRDCVSFLSDDRSLLLIRFFSDEGERWRKISIFQTGSKSFYTIKSTLDLFTKDIITVNIAEGVFDVISIYKNFNDGENSVFIATLGPDYIGALEYMINKGFIGKNVDVKVYIDSDVDEDNLRNQLRKYKWLFRNIFTYTNVKYKDVGVRIENIKLSKSRVGISIKKENKNGKVYSGNFSFGGRMDA